MTGYQFAHVQSYSLKGNKSNRSIKGVLLENSREPGNFNHVKNDPEMNLLFGKNPIDLLEIIQDRVEKAKMNLKGTGLRIQKNTHLMEGAVFSHPCAVKFLKNNKEEQLKYEAWRSDMINYAKKDAEERGLKVLSVVEHLDEPYPHIHVLSIAKATTENPRLDVKHCNVGHIAAKLGAKNGLNAREQMKEYRGAMSRWQDRVYENVSIKNGLTRIGPRMGRLTRPEWGQKKRAAELMQIDLEIKNGLEREIGDLNDFSLERENQSEQIEFLLSNVESLNNEITSLKSNHKLEIEELKNKANGIIREQHNTINDLNQTIEELTPSFTRKR